jgi:hypothetical protein
MKPPKPYVTSAERRRERSLHAVEAENVNLRLRLAAMHTALEIAEHRLREIDTFSAWLAQSCDEVTRRAHIISGKASPATIAKTIAAENAAIEMERQRGPRPTLYVPDRRYARSAK